MNRQTIFIISACHSESRNIFEWRRRESELYKTILYHERHYPKWKIIVMDSTLTDDKILNNGLKNKLIEYSEFGYTIKSLKMCSSGVRVLSFVPELLEKSKSLGIKSFFALFSGNYLINLEPYFNYSANTEFYFFDYESSEEVLNDEVVYIADVAQCIIDQNTNNFEKNVRSSLNIIKSYFS